MPCMYALYGTHTKRIPLPLTPTLLHGGDVNIGRRNKTDNLRVLVMLLEEEEEEEEEEFIVFNLRVLVMLLDDRDIDNGQEQLDQQLHSHRRELAYESSDLGPLLACISSLCHSFPVSSCEQ